MFSDSMPMFRRKPTRTGESVQIIQHLRNSARTCDRSLLILGADAAERFFADQIGNVGNAFLVLHPILMTFISFRSSTSPWDRLFTITRSQPFSSGTLLHSRPLPPPVPRR